MSGYTVIGTYLASTRTDTHPYPCTGTLHQRERSSRLRGFRPVARELHCKLLKWNDVMAAQRRHEAVGEYAVNCCGLCSAHQTVLGPVLHHTEQRLFVRRALSLIIPVRLLYLLFCGVISRTRRTCQAMSTPLESLGHVLRLSRRCCLKEGTVSYSCS